MSPAVALLAGLLVAAAVTAGTTLFFDAAVDLAVPVGLIYGVYAWSLAAYPRARKLRFRSVEGDEQPLVTAFLLVSAALIMLVPPLELPGPQQSVTFLALFGGVIGLSTLGVLLGVHGVFDDEDGGLDGDGHVSGDVDDNSTD